MPLTGYVSSVSEDSSTVTIPQDATPAWETKEKAIRRVSLTLLSLLTVLSLLGLLGVRTTTSASSAGDLELVVTHASVSRPGLATPLSIAVRSLNGPLPSSLTLRLDTSYLAMFDEHGLTPEPSNVWATPRWTWWSFEPPRGERVLEVDFDARLEPSVQWRRAGSVALVTADQVTTEVAVITWITP